MITDERLRWLSGPDYSGTEPAQVAAELLEAREMLRAYGGNGAAAILELITVRREKRELAAELAEEVRWAKTSLEVSASKDDRIRVLEAALRDAREDDYVGGGLTTATIDRINALLPQTETTGVKCNACGSTEPDRNGYVKHKDWCECFARNQ